MKNKYDILELQKLSTLELTSICDEHSIEIQNQFKQSLINAITCRQAELVRIPDDRMARDRYAIAAKITGVMVIAVMLFSSCATLEPKSSALRRNTRLNQQEIQYEHSVSSGKDPLRIYRHGWNAPKRMTRIPLTQLYIF